MKRWVKMPDPGEFRGEGTWIEWTPEAAARLAPTGERAVWDWLTDTGYLPTHLGEAPPSDG